MRTFLKSVPKLRVSTSIGHEGVFVKLVNLASTLGDERVGSFIVILSRLLPDCSVLADWTDQDTFRCVNINMGPYTPSPDDLAKIVHDQIVLVANVAGVECDFGASVRI